jgi:hypothetical protein
LAQYPFLTQRSQADVDALRQASAQFLHSKQFSGAHGLEITDDMALAIAAQACLPVLKLGLNWYDDFQGIVVHPGAMLAPREVRDEAGVVHHYREELSGEAMPGGPVTLSWQDVQQARHARRHSRRLSAPALECAGAALAGGDASGL